LVDTVKLQSVNNAYLSRISTDKLFEEGLTWAKEYRPSLAELLIKNTEYAKAALNIERHTPKDPKRFTTFQDIENQLLFFFDEEWEKMQSNKPALPEYMTKEILTAFVDEYVQVFDLSMTVEEWFEQFKAI
jgi:hypothetical protein